MTRFLRTSDHPSLVVVFIALTYGCLAATPSLWAQEPSPTSVAQITAQLAEPPADETPVAVLNVRITDTPNDDGHALDIRWDASASEAEGRVDHYEIWRAAVIDGQAGEYANIGEVTSGTYIYTDGNVSEDGSYYYKVFAVNDSTFEGTEIWTLRSESAVAGPLTPVAQWFDMQRINVFVGVLLLCGFIIYYITQARAGKELFIRKIAGLEAVDEAVGRATEMGRKIYFIPGSQDMDQVQTIAGITILGRVAEMAAMYETRLDVPVSRSLVMVTAREVVKEAYAKSGRPDSFQEDQVHYLTDDQFGYAAAIDGMVVREKPATIFMMGLFYAESLILAETGNSVGAIQIAGTGEPSQLPFFVAACDYTLIGEELFAASAYLSKEPRQLGSLKGQDIGKGLILVAILIGILLETFGIWDFSKLFKVIE
ncbi:MAG: fibronectin type III domain-containing protein [candidate division Zixibacteria bacterium]|nr:fibronectin type III domain-containing protein [candidate division Zixibacteria bacterium]